ncbi:MAG: IclR family transcriptional regulator [Hyphomicrobiales bacterium]|nr:MAG: IclR family transcriptional regulator [Hyphomicrobiales bacterium]
MPAIKRSEEEEAAAREHGSEFLETLARGLRIIDAFNASRRPMTLSELAKAAGLARATARRTLFTLEAGGYVASDNKHYALTPRILTLATAYLGSNQVATILQPIMDRIADRAREVCSAAVLDGRQAVFIARASPARVFTTGLELGLRLPAASSSVGRVLLGRLSDDDLDQHLAALDLKAVTPFTIVDRSVLKARIIADRQQGYALVDQEAELGFRSIAVPVRRHDGAIVAAMNVGAHVDRISPGKMIDAFLPLLQAGVAEAKPLLV